MPGFVIDEDMPRNTASVLRAAGYDAVDVREVGLQSRPDQEIFEYAQTNQRVIVTADKDFSNELVFPPPLHVGIIVLRLPNKMSIQATNDELLNALSKLAGMSLASTLVIVRPGSIRVRQQGHG